MDKLIDRALGILPQAMEVGSRRLELIAGNLANADTPGFKARDIDFRATLTGLLNGAGTTTMLRTDAGHQAAPGTMGNAEPLYRTPIHPSLDGNTVESQLEQAAFGEASVRYQASLDFLDNRIAGLRKALRGE